MALRQFLLTLVTGATGTSPIAVSNPQRGATVKGIIGAGGITVTNSATDVTLTGGGAPPAAQVGTFTANGGTQVVVSNTSITTNSVVNIGLKTLGGTPAPVYFSAANVVGASFSINSTAGNTSVYSYQIVG